MIDTVHIAVCMKPVEGNFANNALEYGVAGLDVDGSRIGTDVITTHGRGSNQAFPKRPTETTVEESGRKVRQDLIEKKPREGRWPANVILDGSDEVIEEFPLTGVSQEGSRRAGGQHGRYSPLSGQPDFKPGFGDEGSSARFFKQCKEDE